MVPDDLESDEDDLHAEDLVFCPDEEHESRGHTMHKRILGCRETRRRRWAAAMELFHRMNLYDLPDGRLGNLRGLGKAGAPLVGVPSSDTRIKHLRRFLIPQALKRKFDHLYPLTRVLKLDDPNTYRFA